MPAPVLAPPRPLAVADLGRLPESAPFELVHGALVHRTLGTTFSSVEDALDHLHVYGMAPPSVRHQRLLRDLNRLIETHVAENGLGETFFAPIGVRFADDTEVQPDLVFVAADRMGIVTDDAIEGAPDLVVEVLSPSTRRRDQTDKQALYERAGVREYWLVDPKTEAVEIRTLTDAGYQLVSSARGAGAVTSGVLAGFTVSLADLFAR